MNELYVWIAAGALAVLIPLAIYFLPAKARILIDTPTSTARAEVRPLWGMGAALITRALPKKVHGTPLPSFGDVGRVGHALITPGIVDVAYEASKSLLDMKPKVAKLELRLNLADTARTRVVQTAVQAVLAAAPAAFRQNVIVSLLETPGAELSAQFEVMASPAKLSGIYRRLKNARATQEFRRRLTKKSKPDKRLPDVQVR
ncbi:MAG: hypothetical protein NT015_05375 [Alphaproteobacteria bacterium]|nr:hypothetical protein [Alphaproteobacteria bacterium]